ncbi:GTP cyclohydrolase II [Wolinella succinogenes]|uniref:GTP cyclohydrolase II n=1 Tax=Wolinella succinogenes TaxID=844 RepID=UPI00240A56E4|nr:GTP cyclohydrolase II [Wolinella succinogenes]
MTALKASQKAKLPTRHGIFTIQAFVHEGKEHLAIFSDPLPSVPLLRVHSECLTGDVFGSLKCDCGSELSIAMERIAKEGGIALYLRQEGRGIGLFHKVNAYALQDQGYDTVEANLALGFKEDERNYEVVGEILSFYGIDEVKLLTNNPKKVEAMSRFVKIHSREAILAPHNCYNENYLKTKQEKLGHLL